ncbi:hypothetical protein [Flavobacterium limi]|uniref:YD repeat-containing protein n=1 Tax=Flavobacterium limi TaxID=2045105 RepID=A0ABQ1V055_9FLAO|nr:hypothetical protein [Flavobacterium limi]GGF30337.1 hypothetical protein GCM10011518_44480 [Flavobacterium limi]
MNKNLFLLITLLHINFYAQTITSPYTSVEGSLKSPQVHLLKQFVDHPVDLSRGLADVTVPIYDIQFAGQTLPVKLMFHASGLKANAAESGMLGVKWALNAGGFISREVKGIPDEQRSHKQGITMGYTPDWMTLYGGGADRGYSANNFIFQHHTLGFFWGPEYNGVYGKYEDTEYDVFTFSLPNGQSGKFILKDNNGDKSASFMPYKPFKLTNPEVTYAFQNYQFLKFNITDDQGYTYTFGPYWEMDRQNIANSWMLTSITSPNKKDIITYDYTTTTYDGNSEIVPVVINDEVLDVRGDYYIGNDFEGQPDGILMNALKQITWESTGYFQKNYNPVPYHNHDVCLPSKITYNDMVVNFTYSDYQQLAKIEILNDNKIIRQAEFNFMDNAYMFLKSVIIKGSDENVAEKYSFDYYHLDKFPEMNKLANSADYWGYYNSTVHNVIQKDTVNILFRQAGYGGGSIIMLEEEIGSGNNRYSEAEDMKIGMIKSITYPTGGTATFDYEGNQYKDHSNITRQCGGLRIKNITYDAKMEKWPKKREFTYGKNEDGIGKIPDYLLPPLPFVGHRNSFEETKTIYLIDDDVFPDIGHAVGGYTTRHITGSFPGKYYTYLYNLVAYDKVTEYYGEINKNIGKTENYYSINIPLHSDYVFNYSNFTFQQSKYSIDPSSFWNGNHLYKKIEYKNENQIYSKVKETEYLYGETVIDEIYDLSIFPFKNVVAYNTSGIPPSWPAITELEVIKSNPGELFGYKVQKYAIGIENLIQSTEKLYLKNNDSIVQRTINTFDLAKPTFLRERTTISSKGESITQKFSYPFNSNRGVYSQMTTANVISPVIENLTLNNNKVTGSALLTYKKSDDNFVPDKNYTAQFSTPLPFANFTAFSGSTKDSHYGVDPENTYDAYDDHGNPTQITSKGKATTVYIWGYEKDYPISKIENATYTPGQPNTITAAQQALIDNAVTAATGENGLVAETSLRDKLQLLRTGFPDAMVSTFTYDPLIGITSMTDPKGYVMYYEYDAYGRLKQVRDKENKILSANRYNYKNQ